MKYVLLNPNWSFEGSIYFGCREPHLPLEFGYSKQILERAGHECLLVDAHLEGLSPEAVRSRLKAFGPDFTVLATAPSYLFWRCPPPELRVPQETAFAIKGVRGKLIVVGPHASTTPSITIKKLDADAALLGEPEEVLPELAGDWGSVSSLYNIDFSSEKKPDPAVADLDDLPSLIWSSDFIEKHLHHHHCFDRPPSGPGAEIEASRGCPYKCSFCAKENFRNGFRKRPLEKVLAELDGLLRERVKYFYFIDELFTPDRKLLMELALRGLKFGIQTRIDIWDHESLDLLGRAGCVSIEAGVESISEEGRLLFNKRCSLSNAEITCLLIHAGRRVPFVQANLLFANVDSPRETESWRSFLFEHGVWANKPVPLFPYPGSPEYRARWGEPDETAWERAHSFYLDTYSEFSDIQENTPKALEELELRRPKWQYAY